VPASARPEQASRWPASPPALNSRLSTYGHAQVRQDEGGPKLLSDYQPSDSQFGGGLGYLVDADSGELLLTTRFVGAAKAPQQHYQREFGVGYTRRTLRCGAITPEYALFFQLTC
jgi:hypothetical protein